DHAIADPKAFHKAIGHAAQAANTGRLVTFGITPDRAETGYGYIAGGKPIEGCESAFAVARFIEKPQAAEAERYIAAGDYFWNSGIFLFPAALYLSELERLRPDMLAACKTALKQAKADADFIRLDKAAFADCPADSTDDAVMEAPRNRTQEVKRLVARLLAERHDEADALPTVHRPWGTYRSIHNGSRVQVKHITVKPGAKLSLQMHHHRAEHWVVVQGTAKIVRGNEELVLTEDQSTYIPLGTAHRLENPGKIPLHVIEVQSGSYLGEDDIVRFEDHYGRE